MPRGRPPKPIALHKTQGTYRKDRHERPMNQVQHNAWMMTHYHCNFCGKSWGVNFPLACNDAETALICPNCVAGGLLVFEGMGWDMLPDELLAKYCTEAETPPDAS